MSDPVTNPFFTLDQSQRCDTLSIDCVSRPFDITKAQISGGECFTGLLASIPKPQSAPMSHARRGPTFRQCDVSRAVKGARAAGIAVARIEIDIAGKIVTISGAPQDAAVRDDYTMWKEGRNARAAQRH